MYRERKQYALAHLFASKAISIPRPDDILFLDTTTYDWRTLDEYAVASYWTGNYKESAAACEKLRRMKGLYDGLPVPYSRRSPHDFDP